MFTISPHKSGLAHTIKYAQQLLDYGWLNGSIGKVHISLKRTPQHNFLAKGLHGLTLVAIIFQFFVGINHLHEIPVLQ